MARVKLYDQGQLPSAAIDTIQAPNAPADLSGAQALEGIATAVDTVSKSAAAYLGDVQQQNAYNAYIKQREEQRISAAHQTLVRNIDTSNRAIEAKAQLAKTQEDIVYGATNPAANVGRVAGGGQPVSFLHDPEAGVKAYDDTYKQVQDTFINTYYANDPDAALLFTEKLNDARLSGQKQVRNDLVSAKTKQVVAETETALGTLIKDSSVGTVPDPKAEGGLRQMNAFEAVDAFIAKAPQLADAAGLDPALAAKIQEGPAKVAVENLIARSTTDPEGVLKDIQNPAMAALIGGDKYGAIRKAVVSTARAEVNRKRVEADRAQAQEDAKFASSTRAAVVTGNATLAQVTQQLTEEAAKGDKSNPRVVNALVAAQVALEAKAAREESAGKAKLNAEDTARVQQANQTFKLTASNLQTSIAESAARSNAFIPFKRGKGASSKTGREKEINSRLKSGTDPEMLTEAVNVVNNIEGLKMMGVTVSPALADLKENAKNYIEGYNRRVREGAAKPVPAYTALHNRLNQVSSAVIKNASPAKVTALLGRAPTDKDMSDIQRLARIIYSRAYWDAYHAQHKQGGPDVKFSETELNHMRDKAIDAAAYAYGAKARTVKPKRTKGG